MRINPINNQAFTGRYLYILEDAQANAKLTNQINKNSAFIDDHVVLRNHVNNDLLLLTGADYRDYKLMTEFMNTKNPVMDESVYEEKLYTMFAKKADAIDLRCEL